MKKIVLFYLILIFIGSITHVSGHNIISADSGKIVANSQDKAKIEKKPSKSANDSGSNTNSNKNLDDLTRQIIIGFFFIVMLTLLILFFNHLKNRESQRIGYQSIKLIGFILIFPGICILAISGEQILNGETLAVLLGTIAGYVLSREDESKPVNNNPEVEKLHSKIKELEKAIATLKP